MLEHLEEIFLAIFAVYLLITVAGHIRGREPEEPQPPSLFRALAQSPLVLLAFVLAWQFGAIDRALFSLPLLLLGLIAGHVIFVCSVLLTHRVASDAWQVLLDLAGPRDFFVNNPNVVIRITHLSLTEELIYRAVLQAILIDYAGPGLGIGLTAALFALSHEHLFRNRFWESLEFVVFSVFLGALYFYTSSLALVVTIHAVRNFAIAHIEFHGRVEELGSEAAAQAELDRAMRQPVTEPG